jgi:hypothetical protein
MHKRRQGVKIMNTSMVVGTFKPNTNMQEVFAVVAEERAQVAVLRSAGQIGSIPLALPRATVFLEIFAPDEPQAVAIVKSLPMSRWWNLDLYPTSETTPPGRSGASVSWTTLPMFFTNP